MGKKKKLASLQLAPPASAMCRGEITGRRCNYHGVPLGCPAIGGLSFSPLLGVGFFGGLAVRPSKLGFR